MKLTSSRTALAVASVFLLGVAASACGDDDDAGSDTTTAAAVTTPAAPDVTDAPAATAAAGTTGGSAAAGGSVVGTATTDLGTFLVDSAGMTLYVFVPDDAGPSTCEGDCLAAWPALAGPVTAGDGVDAALLGTATRADDGTEQASYDGWPLYYFAQDAAPGDVNGQGVGDNWFVVDASGQMIGAA